MAFMSNIKPQVEFVFNRRCVPPSVYFSQYSAMTSKLGIYIKPRLKALKMTQTQLAEDMDVSINAVSKWIKTGKISRENFFSLVKILGSEGAPHLDEILEHSNDDQEKALLAELRNTDPLAIEGMRLIAMLSPNDQLEIVHYLKIEAKKALHANELPGQPPQDGDDSDPTHPAH